VLLRPVTAKVQVALGVIRGFLETIRHLLNEAYECPRLGRTKQARVHVAEIPPGLSNVARNIHRVHRTSPPYLCNPSRFGIRLVDE
jgi:hypothetical protein